MILEELTVQNFRSIRKETFRFQSLAILIGKNNSGKSNVLEATRILLEGTGKDVCLEDFFDEGCDIEIRGTFSGVRDYLPLCDQQHRTKVEARIDPQDRIVLRRTVGASTQKLGKIEIRDNSGEFGTPTGIDAGLRSVLPEVVSIMPLDDPSDEATAKGTKALGKLLRRILEMVEAQVQPELDRAYRQANAMLNVVAVDQEGSRLEQDDRVPDLRRIESKVATHLQDTFPRATVRLRVGLPALEEIMGQVEVKVLEGGVETAIERQGHGVQRALYLSLLQTLAEEIRRGDEGQLFRPFMLIMEEPELFLHPSAQERMRDALEVIASRAQVLVATHSPLVVSPSSLRQVILFDKTVCQETGKEMTRCRAALHATPISADERDLIALLNLQRSSRIFFSDKVILVEGISDWYLLDAMAERLIGSSLSKLGIGVVEVGGKDKLVRFKGILETLGLAVQAVADLDFLYSGAGDVLGSDPEYSQFCQQLNNRVDELCPENDGSEQANRVRKAKMIELCCSELRPQRDELCTRLRSNGIFMLKEGEMHEYAGLGETSKGRYLIAAREILAGERDIQKENEIREIVEALALPPVVVADGSYVMGEA
ncbi:MAG TPA: AAA family ATPase [Anaerolineae bacterium]|nr:AAA family ATPase [Anaerolineae bacterium]